MMATCTWKGECNFLTTWCGLIITLTSFYFGPHTQVGNDFEQSYEGFTEGFQKPFVKHVQRCFRGLPSTICCRFISIDHFPAEHVCKERALRASAKHDDQEKTIIQTLSKSNGDPPATSESVISDDHSMAMGQLEIGGSKPNVEDIDDDIQGPNEVSDS